MSPGGTTGTSRDSRQWIGILAALGLVTGLAGLLYSLIARNIGSAINYAILLLASLPRDRVPELLAVAHYLFVAVLGLLGFLLYGPGLAGAAMLLLALASMYELVGEARRYAYEKL
ncbi:hypothetical protein [Pyrodictium abyssi]|uniref:Uncharacterized protein n=1 Tax=Pyrodictium abyssi TaxID=54256 RepID=A0ABM8IW26_9CREN|nr:hypothetical protein PABY_13300 [Pyrodictium abyssi]